VGLKIAAGSVSRDRHASAQISRKIVLSGQSDPNRIGTLLAFEEVGRFHPVERMADEDDRDNLGFGDFRRRQE
jgi:hypothetical protein